MFNLWMRAALYTMWTVLAYVVLLVLTVNVVIWWG